MTAQLVREDFPTLRDTLLEFVTAHEHIEGEPLHLALAYSGAGPASDLRLLEVIGNFGAEMVDPDRRLLEVAYPGSQIFPRVAERRDVRLVLTSPSELRAAVREEWDTAAAIRAAVRAGMYEVLASDGVGNELMAELSRATAA